MSLQLDRKREYCVVLLCHNAEQNMVFSANDKKMCINIYHARLDDTMPACGMNWPPDIKPVTTYLDVCQLCALQ